MLSLFPCEKIEVPFFYLSPSSVPGRDGLILVIEGEVSFRFFHVEQRASLNLGSLCLESSRAVDYGSF